MREKLYKICILEQPYKAETSIDAIKIYGII